MAKHTILKQAVLKTSVSCPQNEYVRIGERKVLAGELLALGFSINSGQDSSLGRAYFDPQAGAVDMNGTLRIYIHDASDIPKVQVFEGHTSELRANIADRRTWRVLEQRSEWVKENSRLVFFFKNDDATATMTAADSTLYFDSTLENV